MLPSLLALLQASSNYSSKNLPLAYLRQGSFFYSNERLRFLLAK